MSEYEYIRLEVTPAGLAILSLDRAEKHNAFNADLIAELTQAFDLLRANDTVRVLALRSEGRSFSAGADLDWMRAAADYTEAENEADAYQMAEMLRKLHTLPQLTCAVVQGNAFGGGVGLIAACDVALALDSVTFALSEVKLGIIAATISPYVIEAVGPRWAKALFVTAESFDAKFAHQIGLIQYTAKDDLELQGLLEHVCDMGFAAAPGAIAASKQLVLDVAGKEIDSHLSHLTAKRIAHQRASDEGREGIAAFLEKRKPNWAG